MSYNASAVAEPASTIGFPGSATFPTEIWLPSSGSKQAGWDEGRRRRPQPATFLLDGVRTFLVKVSLADTIEQSCPQPGRGAGNLPCSSPDRLVRGESMHG